MSDPNSANPPPGFHQNAQPPAYPAGGNGYNNQYYPPPNVMHQPGYQGGYGQPQPQHQQHQQHQQQHQQPIVNQVTVVGGGLFCSFCSLLSWLVNILLFRTPGRPVGLPPLSNSPVRAVCPNCHQETITKVHFAIGCFTYLMAGLILFLGCWLVFHR